MEFKTLRNIENSFRQIRLYAIVFALLCGAVTGYALWKSYGFAELQRQKIYVLDREAMPIKRQHKVILYFFTAYALLTAVVLFNVCRDTAEARNSLDAEHPEKPNPVRKESPSQLQDSLTSILKEQHYERD